MAVTIDEPGNEDRTRRVDDLRSGWRLDVTTHLDDVLALNVHVSGGEVAERGIHRDDGSAPQQEVARRVDGRTRGRIHGAAILPRRGALCSARRANGCGYGSECRAHLQESTTRD